MGIVPDILLDLACLNCRQGSGEPMASAEQAHPNLELKNQRKAAALEDTSSPCHEHALNVIAECPATKSRI